MTNSRPLGVKRSKRIRRWQLDWPLLTLAAVAGVAIVALAGWLYYQNSSQLDQQLLRRAEQAEQKGDYRDQIRWLYVAKLNSPDNLDISERFAIANEEFTSLASPISRSSVSNAITAIGDTLILIDKKRVEAVGKSDLTAIIKLEETEIKLRRLRIRQLEKLGPRSSNRVLSDCVEIPGMTEDPELLRAFALARYHEEMGVDLEDGGTRFRKIKENAYSLESDWVPLIDQPLGDLVLSARKLNRSDFSLASAALTLASDSPEVFSDAIRGGDERFTANLSDGIISEMREADQDGRTQLLVYQYLTRTDADAANTHLAVAAEKALDRMQAYIKNQGTIEDDGPPQNAPPSRTSEAAEYNPRWDFEIILLSTLAEGSGNDTDARREGKIVLLEQLNSMLTDEIPASLAALSFRQEGRLKWESGQRENAWKAWSNGADSISGSAIDLVELLAITQSQFGAVSDALTAIERLDKSISNATLRVAKENALSPAERTRAKLRITQVTWSKDMAKADVAIREKRWSDASKLLSDLTSSQADVSIARQVRAKVLYADLLSRRGNEDLAAMQLAAASELDPANEALTEQSARSWQRAGNPLAALREWNSISSLSLELAIQRLRALVSAELYKPPGERDFDQVQTQAELLRKRAESVPEQDQELRQAVIADLDLIQLTIEGGSGSGAISKPALDRLQEIATENPDNGDVQSLAAITFASSNDAAKTEQALKRLVASQGDKAENSLLVCRTRAQVAVRQDEPQSAIKLLESFAAQSPKDAAAACVMAADIAVQLNEIENGIRLLKSIPEPQRTPQVLFRLCQLSLPKQNTSTREETRAATKTSEDDFSKAISWANQLRELEGPDGTWWRLANINRLVAQAQTLAVDDDDNDDERKTLLRKASDLAAELIQTRPMWSAARVAEGRLATELGRNREAIQAFRRAISYGDSSSATVMQLVSLLTKANRLDEAEAELSRLNSIAKSNRLVDSFSTKLALAISARSQDFRRTLMRARDSAERRVDSVDAQLDYAKASLSASRLLVTPVNERANLRSEAANAIERAIELSGNSNIEAYFLKLQLLSISENEEDVREALIELEKSKVPEPSKSLLLARSYLAFGELQQAFVTLTRLRKDHQDAPDLHIVTANYHRLNREPLKELESLEKANELAPDREDIRSRLATAIFINSGTDIPWSRLANLIGNSSKSADRLTYAMFLMNAGGNKNWQEAEKLLRDEIKTDEKNMDAQRVLARLLERRWASAAQRESSATKRYLSEAIFFRRRLANDPDASLRDAYAYANLLLETGEFSEVEKVAAQIEEASVLPTLDPLNLRLRSIKARKEVSSAGSIIDNWVQTVVATGKVTREAAMASAGVEAARRGFHQEAIPLLADAYSKNEAFYQRYLSVLQQAGEISEAIKLCETEFERTKSSAAIAALANLYSCLEEQPALPEEIERIISAESLGNYSDISLLTAVATLCHIRERNREAEDIFRAALLRSPNSPVLLNNYAIMLSQMRGREREALTMIRRAIGVAGRDPNLLDTLATVYSRLGESDLAITALREATASSDEPLFRVHLIRLLLKTGKTVEARVLWKELDVQAIQRSPLPIQERNTIEKLRVQMGGETASTSLSYQYFAVAMPREGVLIH